jgi:outer membrane protein assembly factor BamB
MNPRLIVVAAALLGALTQPRSPAADWPQWRGINRDGLSAETGLLKSFPSAGPTLVWKSQDVGLGYSTVAVVGGIVYGFGSTGDRTDEFLYALDSANGKEKWRTTIKNIQPDKTFNADWGGGPRGTPTVDGDRIYALGAQGDLVCVETATGKLVWHKSMTKDFKGKLMSPSMWGYSESPLVDGDQVVCSPGGSDGTLAALDKKTGNVLWRSKDISAAATYSSIIVATVGDVRHYVQLTADGPAGFSPKDGTVLWHEKVTDFKTAAIPTPIFHDNMVYVTAAYGAGCGMVKLTPDGNGGLKSEVAYTKKVIENHHGGAVLVGEHVYSCDKSNGLTCQELKTGKVAWSAEKKVDTGSLIAADGCIYCYGQRTGSLVCVEANPAKFVEKGRFTIPQKSTKRKKSGGIWTHPVIADGKLYLRDQELLFCFDLRESRAQK